MHILEDCIIDALKYVADGGAFLIVSRDERIIDVPAPVRADVHQPALERKVCRDFPEFIDIGG